jgi:hypothetical protein
MYKRLYLYVFISLVVCLLFFFTIKSSFATDKNGRDSIEVYNPEKLIVLYNLQYRTWKNTADSQIKFLKFVLKESNLENCFVGIHYWSDDESPNEPPESILTLKNKFTTSENIINDNSGYIMESKEYCYRQMKRIHYSLKRALDNAEEIYGSVIPDDQLILVLRPDAMLDENFTLPPKNESYYFMSLTRHENKEYDDMTPIMAYYITKKALDDFLNSDYEKYDYIFGTKNSSIEKLFNVILKDLGIKEFHNINDTKVKMLKNDGNIQLV